MGHTPLEPLLRVVPVASLNPANLRQVSQRYPIRVRKFLLGRGLTVRLLGFAGLGIFALEGGTTLHFSNDLARRRGGLMKCGRHLSHRTRQHEYRY